MKANQCLYTPTDWNRECELMKGYLEYRSTFKTPLEIFALFRETQMLWGVDPHLSFDDWKDVINGSEMKSKEFNNKIELYGQKYTSIQRDGYHFLLMDFPEF